MSVSLGVDSTSTALWCSNERRTESDDKRRVESVIIWSRLFVFFFSFYSAGIKVYWTSLCLNSITWPGLFTSQTVRKHRKFISDHKDFIIHMLSFLIFHPHFVICIFPPAFFHPHFTICIFPPTICHVPSSGLHFTEPLYKVWKFSSICLVWWNVWVNFYWGYHQ